MVAVGPPDASQGWRGRVSSVYPLITWTRPHFVRDFLLRLIGRMGCGSFIFLFIPGCNALRFCQLSDLLRSGTNCPSLCSGGSDLRCSLAASASGSNDRTLRVPGISSAQISPRGISTVCWSSEVCFSPARSFELLEPTVVSSPFEPTAAPSSSQVDPPIYTGRHNVRGLPQSPKKPLPRLDLCAARTQVNFE